MYGNHQIVKLLLDTENINIDNQTNLGDTPLMIACENAFGSVVSLLLKHNANVYLKNHYHQTALHIACSKGLNPIIIQFLKYKKKMDFLDEDDLFLSPYQMLKLNGNTTYLGIVMDYEITYLKTLMCYYNSESTADDFSEKYTYYLSEDEGKKEKDKEKEIEKENNNDNDYDNENNNDNDNNDNNDNNKNDNNNNNDNDNHNNDNDNDFEGENESENDNEERKINSLESKKR
jgi:ankyrin repeat protein